jgi:hypothetical protein
VGETRPSAPERTRKVSPGRAKGDSPDQGPDPTTSTEGDMIMPFSKEMTHGTAPEPECHVCRAGLTSADRSGIRNVRQAVGP